MPTHWYRHAVDLLPEAPELWIAAPEPQIAFGRALGAAGQLKQARQAIVRALELLPSEAIAARVSPIADCAGMEHPLGHHESPCGTAAVRHLAFAARGLAVVRPGTARVTEPLSPATDRNAPASN